jgi:hypothetical protein
MLHSKLQELWVGDEKVLFTRRMRYPLSCMDLQTLLLEKLYDHHDDTDCYAIGQTLLKG